MTDRYNILSQMEHLQSKYMGTGHADATKFEWATHQHRFILYPFWWSFWAREPWLRIRIRINVWELGPDTLFCIVKRWIRILIEVKSEKLEPWRAVVAQDGGLEV
jgi:hypothetical protein